MIKPNPQFKKPTVLLDDNRPSFNNRRISLEQIELPDGRICTRVPARKRGKVRNLFDLSVVFSFDKLGPVINRVRHFLQLTQIRWHRIGARLTTDLQPILSRSQIQNRLLFCE